VTSTEELRDRMTTVFALTRDGRLNVRIGLRLPLAEVAQAHRMLESRQTTGKIVLIP
jgi:NADPH2:quinone reductase